MFAVCSTTPSSWHRPRGWPFSVVPLLVVLTTVQPLLTGASAPCVAIARWPALDFKSDRAFYPLMVSFSRYPFHDVYETGVHPAPARHPVAPVVSAGNRQFLPKARKPFFTMGAAQRERDWWQQMNGRASPKGVCQGLIYLPEQLKASGRRVPPKMRKLLKYCGFI